MSKSAKKYSSKKEIAPASTKDGKTSSAIRSSDRPFKDTRKEQSAERRS